MQLEKLITNSGIFFSDVKIIIPQIFEDNRGYFYESWNRESFNSMVKTTVFCQENHSYSKKNTLRGLHFQIEPYSQAKFVECISGEIYDVVVDIRKDSPTFLQWGGVKLSEGNHKQLFIPEGYAHGFYTLSDNAHLIYKVNNHWHQEAERTIIWNDPNLSINWLQLSTTPLLSDKDASGKRIDELLSEEFF